jgi:hypothetical protein
LSSDAPFGAPRRARLSIGQQVVHRQLLELVRQQAALLPGARVAIKENARGEVVIAIIVPASEAGR